MRGFTLVEIAIVISITAILSAILLGYNRSSERQIFLYTDQAKVASFLNRAKAFALERRLTGPEEVCAFGVHFTAPRQMTLFKDLCPANFQYDNDEALETLLLDNRIEFVSFPTSTVFEPPYLTTRNYGNIIIRIVGTTASESQATILVGPGGEISTP